MNACCEGNEKRRHVLLQAWLAVENHGSDQWNDFERIRIR
jgi:hypothetical protein